MKKFTVGELRAALIGVPDELEVKLSSDSGIDQGGAGETIIEFAKRITYENADHFVIYAN